MVGRAISCPSIRLVIAVLALAAFGSAGCQFNPSGQTGGGDGDGSVPEPSDSMQPPDPPDPIDARETDGRVPDVPDARVPDAAVPPDAAVLPPDGELVARNLLTRYFIDESNSGSGVTALQDSASNPLPLSINYGGDGAFIENGGSRGLRWNSVTEDGRASAPVPLNSKIRRDLNGSTRATIEVVFDIDGFAAGGRISHIGEGDDRGNFTLRLEQPETVRFIMNNDDAQQVDWALALVGRERTVLHLVLDTTQAAPADRVRLYIDGAEQPNLDLTVPDQNEAIDIRSTNPFYVLGNINDGGRGIAGTIFYAAMYSTALDPAEVQHNAEVLDTNDDAP